MLEVELQRFREGVNLPSEIYISVHFQINESKNITLFSYRYERKPKPVSVTVLTDLIL